LCSRQQLPELLLEPQLLEPQPQLEPQQPQPLVLEVQEAERRVWRQEAEAH
jgi:hypothetical protein